jgi:hypothetical protein
MKIFAYYLAIVMLILFVGVVIYRLLFGTPCTIVGNYCVGDGWSIAGLAATILGVSATVLGILGAFALAAWWTDLDKKVRDQVDASMNDREKALNQRVDAIVQQQELKISIQFQKDLLKFSDHLILGLSESKRLTDELDEQIKSLRSEYENIRKMAENTRKLAIDVMMFDQPWNITNQAISAVVQYKMVDVAVGMVDKYLRYVEEFLTVTPATKTQYIASLISQKTPSTDIQWFWEYALLWQRKLINSAMSIRT